MKKILILLIIFLCSFTCYAQIDSLFYADFEGNNLDSKFKEARIDEDGGGWVYAAPNPEKDAVNSSNYVMLASTQNNPNGDHERAELYTDWGTPFPTENVQHIYQWYVYFPIGFLDDVNIDGDWNLITQFATDPCANGRPGWGSLICGGGGIFNEIRINRNDYSEYRFEFRAEPDCDEIPFTYTTGEWIKLTKEIYWTTGTNGYYKVWMNNVLLDSADNVQTLPTGYLGDGSCGIRWKTGLYSKWTSSTVDSVYYYADELALYRDTDIEDICPDCEGVASVDSTATDILTFTITDQISSVVTEADSSVVVTMPYGTNVTSLTPTITLSTGASSDPNTGVSQDFTNEVAYDVTSLKSNTQEWGCSVVVQDAPPGPPSYVDTLLFNFVDGVSDTLEGWINIFYGVTSGSYEGIIWEIFNEGTGSARNGDIPITNWDDNVAISHIYATFDSMSFVISNLPDGYTYDVEWLSSRSGVDIRYQYSVLNNDTLTIDVMDEYNNIAYFNNVELINNSLIFTATPISAIYAYYNGIKIYAIESIGPAQFRYIKFANGKRFKINGKYRTFK